MFDRVRLAVWVSSILIIFVSLFVASSVDQASAPVVSAAQVDYFLKIKGIDGESKSEGHEDEIEISSFSWGATTESPGNSRRAGTPSVSDMVVSKTVDKSSPLLMQACLSGQRFADVVLSLQKSGEVRLDYLVITLKDVQCTGYEITGESGQNPTESLSLNFTKIEYKYTGQNSDGTQGGEVKAGWDIQANKKV